MSATASHAIDEYVAGLSRRLTGPRRAKADLLAEARDGLTDATEAYVAAGLPPSEAAARAVSDFGAYRQVAPAYQTELAAAQGRLTGILVLIVMPLGIGLSQLMPGRNAPDSGFLLMAHTFQVLQLTALIMAALTLLGYGWGSRYLPAERVPASVLLTRLMGVGVLFFVTAQVAIGIIVYAWSLRTWPDAVNWPLVLAGAALLPLCLFGVGRSALGCLRATGLRAADLRSGAGLLVPRLR